MALINIEDDFDSWISDFSALERLTQQISMQITERDSQNTVTGKVMTEMNHSLSFNDVDFIFDKYNRIQ